MPTPIGALADIDEHACSPADGHTNTGADGDT
jgi:hypothetical protein